MSLSGIRGYVYALFGTIVLSMLWVTSLTVLSAQPNATALISAAGSDMLNPFLTKQGLGLTQSTYASLEATAAAHPGQSLALPLLKIHVLGSEIKGHTYAEVVHIVYARAADTYYTGGAGAVFDVPPQLKQVLPNFAVFNPDNIAVVPGGPTVTQLPGFLQPFFVFTGLTPTTFTQVGHQRLLGLLPWFLLATGVLLVLAIVLNPSEKKLAGLAEGVVHSSWPIVAILVGLWVASQYYKATFAPYAGVLGVIRGAFLPVYGTALVVGLLGIGLITVLPAILKRRQSAAPVTPVAPIGAAVGAMTPDGGGALPPTDPPVAPPQS